MSSLMEAFYSASDRLSSSLLSGSFADAWGGADGWMMGFLVQALLLFFAFLFSFPVSDDGEHARKFGTYRLYTGAGITIFLGIANRFRFYPFSYMGIDYTYLSTLGNIDWFCGYLSVVVPILMGDLYLARLDRQSGRKIYVKELLLVMSFLILILSGTESCYLILGVCFVSLAIVSVQNQAGLPAFLEQLAAFCLLPVLLHICLITSRPELDRYLYENTQGIFWRLIHDWYGVALLAAAVSILLWKSRIRNTTSRHAAPVKSRRTPPARGIFDGSLRLLTRPHLEYLLRNLSGPSPFAKALWDRPRLSVSLSVKPSGVPFCFPEPVRNGYHECAQHSPEPAPDDRTYRDGALSGYHRIVIADLESEAVFSSLHYDAPLLSCGRDSAF